MFITWVVYISPDGTNTTVAGRLDNLTQKLNSRFLSEVDVLHLKPSQRPRVRSFVSDFWVIKIRKDVNICFMSIR